MSDKEKVYSAKVACPEPGCRYIAKSSIGLGLHRRSHKQQQVQAVTAEPSAELQERDERIAVLEQRTIRDFPVSEKVAYLAETLKGLDNESVTRLMETVGHGDLLATVGSAEAHAEVEGAPGDEPQAEAEGESEADTEAEAASEDAKPGVIHGRTDLPGYRYLKFVGVSIPEGEDEPQAEAEAASEPESKRQSIQGRTDLPGYRYLPTLDMSIPVAEAELQTLQILVNGSYDDFYDGQDTGDETEKEMERMFEAYHRLVKREILKLYPGADIDFTHENSLQAVDISPDDRYDVIDDVGDILERVFGEGAWAEATES